MRATVDMVTFDTHDPRELAGWWRERLDAQVVAEDDGFVVLLPASGRPALGFQRVSDATPGKNRVHVDLGAQDPEAAVDGFLAAGATRVAGHTLPDGFAWTVLADPHGNQFCVSAAHTD